MAYAKCGACGKTMAKGHGCSYGMLLMKDGTRVPRVRFGDSGEATDGGCHDCNVREGQYHHPGCDMAACPVCGGQESFCDCPIEGYEFREAGRSL